MPSRWAPSRSVVSKTWNVVGLHRIVLIAVGQYKRPPAGAEGLRVGVELGPTR